MESDLTLPIALVVEDDNLIRMETVDIIRDAGFAVLEAWSASMAVRMIEANPGIRLVFTDIVMPGPLNGLDLANLVTRRWPEMAVMVCSGPVKVGPRDLPSSIRFFSKPFSSDAVTDAAREAMAA